MTAGVGSVATRHGPFRGPQSFVSGATLIALSLFALWLTSDLPQGTLRAMGPAMLPRWLAIGVGICGALLVAIGLIKHGHALESFTFRGPVVVVLAILCFGVAIRGFDLGVGTVPQLGLMIAGPLAIFVSGFASPEARFRELVILALALTAGCMILFGDLLNLPIPMYPQAFADLYPASWSNDDRLRATAAIMIALAAAFWFATHRRHPAREPIDVVPDEHAGTI